MYFGGGMGKEFIIGVIGAPNVGKTSLFNNISGANEKVGNWPGTTVERVEKKVNFGGKVIKFVDVPGTYSLSASSLDEKIARDFILGEKPDLVVVVVNATNLYNSLFLVLEVLELGFDVIVALNMIDIAQKNGIKIDIQKLSQALGVKVIPTVGRTSKGVVELKKEILQEIEKISKEGKKPKSFSIPYPSPIEEGISKIISLFKEKNISTSLNIRGVAVKILEENDFVIKSKVMFNNIWEEVSEILKSVDINLRSLSNDSIDAVIVRSKYNLIEKLIKSSVEKTLSRREILQRKVDEILTSKSWGLLIFITTMVLVFQIVFTIGDPLANLIEEGFSSLSEVISNFGEEKNLDKTLISFINDGVISGVGSVLVFLPYIATLFLLIGILENSGLLARSAVVMDKIMTKFGLHGKSFLPMLIGFGCNIPGIMATRTLSSFKDRLITILVLPLISCSARLTVFTLFVASLFKNYQGIILSFLYFLGILLAGIFGIIFRKNFAKGEYSLFVMEIPEIRLPSIKVLISETTYRSWLFIRKAGTIIFLVVVLVWLLGSLPFGVEYASENSLLGIIGKTLQPIFIPTGFGEHWQVVVSIFTAILAREAVIGTLGTLYGVSEEGITNILPQIFTPLSAISFLIFMQIAMLCIATVVVISNEIGKKWGIFSFTYTIITAWILSTIVYNVGRFLGF